MKKTAIIFTYVLLWAGWYLFFPYLMRWYEGFSFFTTLPDFAGVHFSLPGDIFDYMSSFLLQFYRYPAAGAAIQAAFPVLSVLCFGLIVRRLFKDADSLFWLAFIPLPVLVYIQLADMTLVRPCIFLSCSAVLASAVWILTIFVKPGLSIPEILHKRWFAVVAVLAALAVSFFLFMHGPLGRQHEEIARLEYYGEHKEWGKILETVSPQDAMTNEYKRKYILLALSETGQLPEFAFRYGLSGSQDFYFHDAQGPLSLNFNILFYRGLGIDNPVVYYAYQQSLQSLPGVSFDAVRALADIYIEKKDYQLAAKYVEILAHTSCHRRWVSERLPLLEALRSEEPAYDMRGDKFVLENFLHDISSLVERYPDNRKFADYLLCGILADKDGSVFFNTFSQVSSFLYPEGKEIPRLYQEALLLIASQKPEILDRFHIDEEIWKSFTDFTGMMQKGRVAQAKRKYAGTYWAYVY